jgi:hypothetical protein
VHTFHMAVVQNPSTRTGLRSVQQQLVKMPHAHLHMGQAAASQL